MIQQCKNKHVLTLSSDQILIIPKIFSVNLPQMRNFKATNDMEVFWKKIEGYSTKSEACVKYHVQ